MKKILFCTIAVMFAITSCVDTDNTGDLYGQWKLITITDNGKEISSPKNLTLAFQSDIIMARYANHENHGSSVIPGVFHELPDSVVLSFYISSQWTDNIIHNQYLMDGDPENQRFALKKSSDAFVLTRGARQWRFISYSGVFTSYCSLMGISKRRKQ